MSQALRKPPIKVQILSRFTAPLQDYNPHHPQIEAQIPDGCPKCSARKLERNGTYKRQVWLPHVLRLLVLRLRCRSCNLSVSMLPSFCVPFKRHGASTVEACLKRTLADGVAASQWLREPSAPGLCASTARRWKEQFVARSGILATEACERFGLAQKGGLTLECQAKRLWQALTEWADCSASLAAFQVALTRQWPCVRVFQA